MCHEDRSEPPATDEVRFAWPTLALLHGLPVAAAERRVGGGLIAAAARTVAEDARRLRLPCERALVALKDAWSGLPEVRRLPFPDALDLLDRLVTATIEAYSAGPADLPGDTEDRRAAVRAVPAGGARAQSLRTARTLLAFLDAYAPDGRSRYDGDRTPTWRAESDAELEDRLTRALGDLPTADVAALVQELEQLHAALRAHRWPRITRHDASAQHRSAAAMPRFRPR